MKKELQSELKKLYEAPPPKGKRSFFREVNPKPISIRHMIWIQISYISKWEWILSTAFFGIIVFISHFSEIILFSAALAMVPFLAVVFVSESMRSITYNMEELEMASRFSLKGIMLARMGVVGLENLILEIMACLLLQQNFLSTVFYLIVPYLITVYASLYIVRYFSGREGIYACAGVSSAVSTAVTYVSIYHYDLFFQERYALLWMAAVLILFYMVIKECMRIMNYMECMI